MYARRVFNACEPWAYVNSSVRLCVETDGAIHGQASSVHDVWEIVENILPSEAIARPIVVALEGAYMKGGFSRKSALAYAQRVGWFHAAMVDRWNAHVAVVPPAFGKAGSWKQAMGIAGLDESARIDKASEVCGIVNSIHEAEAVLLCEWLVERVEKAILLPSFKPPKVLKEALKGLKGEISDAGE